MQHGLHNCSRKARSAAHNVISDSASCKFVAHRVNTPSIEAQKNLTACHKPWLWRLWLQVGQLDQIRSPLELEAALRSMLLKLSMTGSALHPLPPGLLFKYANILNTSFVILAPNNFFVALLFSSCLLNHVFSCVYNYTGEWCSGSSFKVLACATKVSSLSHELWADEFAPRRVQQTVGFIDPDRDNGAAADIDVAHQITPIKTISVAGSLHMQLYVDSSLS